MKSFRCGDVVPGCTRRFTGTEQDILNQVARHAHDDHGGMELGPALLTRVRSAMTPVAG